jgi:hypothetical protein
MKRFAFACCLALSFTLCVALGFRGAACAAPTVYIPQMAWVSEPYATLAIDLTNLSSSEVSDSSFYSVGAAVCDGAVYVSDQALGEIFRIDLATQAVSYIYPWHPTFGVACDPQAHLVYLSASDRNTPPTHYIEVVSTQWPYDFVKEISLGVQPADCDPAAIDVIPNASAYGIYMGNECGRLYCIYPNGTYYYMLPGQTTAGVVDGVAALPSLGYVYATFAPSSGSANGSVKRIDATACQLTSTGFNVTIAKPTGGVYSIPYGIAITHQPEANGKYGAYVTDSANSIIRRVTINATTGAMALASGYDSPAWGATAPKGIAVSPDDSSVWVCLQNSPTGNGEVDAIFLPTGQTRNYPTVGPAGPPVCLGKFIAP